MKRYCLTSLVFFFITTLCFAQGGVEHSMPEVPKKMRKMVFGVIENPAFGMSTSPEVKIKKIELTKDYTAFHFSFITPAEYVFGGWAAALESMYLRDVNSKRKFHLIETVNIPNYPEKHNFTAPGQRLDFVLIFEPVDSITTAVDIIENIEGGFNFFNIILIHIA